MAQDRMRDFGPTPDPRFTLANERTFLAWIRTALAMIAGGIGLEAFAGDVLPAVLRTVLAVVLLVMGALLAAGAFFRWRRAEIALRRGDDFPATSLAPTVSGVLAVVSLVVALVVVIRG